MLHKTDRTEKERKIGKQEILNELSKKRAEKGSGRSYQSGRLHTKLGVTEDICNMESDPECAKRGELKYFFAC